jgi:hypothetical protein
MGRRKCKKIDIKLSATLWTDAITIHTKQNCIRLLLSTKSEHLPYKKDLIDQIIENIVSVALSKHGKSIIDIIKPHLDTKTKEKIAEKLIANKRRLIAVEHAKKILLMFTQKKE